MAELPSQGSLDAENLFHGEYMDNDQLISFYDKWASTYDKDVSDVEYNGSQIAADYLNKHLLLLGFGKDSAILDVGAGTGLQAEILKCKYGYAVLDAHDGSELMLNAAREKNVYRNYYCCFIGGGSILPIRDNQYDAAIMTGCFAKSHMKCDSLLEVIRVVKPGGIVVNVMRHQYTKILKEYQKLEVLCKQWDNEGLWHCLETTTQPNYIKNKEALVQVYQIC